MRSYLIVLLLTAVSNTYLMAQQDMPLLQGTVEDVSKQPLVGASVFWADGSNAVLTDTKGIFAIPYNSTQSRLVASYVGYTSDTLEIPIGKKGTVQFILQQGVELQTVEVKHKITSTFSSSLEPMKIQVMTEHELNKAACCNLSESFETNPSVDVSFTDAVTGTKQIQMLGLAGPYIQISRENMPYIRGLSAVHGLTFVPGPWVQAIHLNKGAGSVVNGFESITGQIDVQYRNPFTMDKFFLNLYASPSGRYEANVATKYSVAEHMSTALLLHGKTSQARHDSNNDGFMDMPIGNQIIALNRWEIENHNGLHVQFGIKGTYVESLAGQMNFERTMTRDTLNPWGLTSDIQRVEAWAKAGKVFQNKPGYSFGSQFSVSQHNQQSRYGLRYYDAQQQSGYANGILQGIIGNTNHGFKTGASVQYDSYIEDFNSTQYNRIEVIPGIFGEYTFTYLTKFNAVLGLRGDYHSEFGVFATPRIHIRYAPTQQWTLRASGGRGQRTANIFTENSNLLASSRTIEIVSNSSYGYGLLPEVAWNYGINITRTFTINYRKGAISLDAYRTHFQNQIVVDFVQDPHKAIFYNLQGESFSNSIQTQIDYELIKRLDVRIAYRWYDVKTTYNGVLQDKPLISKHRAFINMAYKTRNHLAFDYTCNWHGSKPIPSLQSNPIAYQLPLKSPHFITMNAQISKTWNETFELYAGGENVLNFKQHNPILSAAEPYSPYFDSSLIWGPVYGRELYVGLRYRIK